MSRELEAFVRLEQSSKRYKGRKEDLDTIFTALKRLEKIEDTRCIILSGRASGKTSNLKVIAKLQAFEIIKEKKVNLEYLKCCETYEQYKTICSYWNEITKKEFDLLKEVLV